MILIMILVLAQGKPAPFNFTNLGSCTNGPYFQLDYAEFDNFPPPRNTLTIRMKATLQHPALPDTYTIQLYGNQGHHSEYIDIIGPPPLVPHPTLEITGSVSVSTENQESYVAQLIISNCFEVFFCHQMTFSLWKNLK